MSISKPSGVPAVGVSSRLESSFWQQALLLVLWVALWMGLQSLMTAQGLGAKPQVGLLLLGLFLFLGGAFLGFRDRFLRLLISIPFAITQVFLLGLSVALGIFVPQEVSQIQSLDSWTFSGECVQFLHLGDVFHSLWFLALLAVLSLSMLVVAWKRRPYRLMRVGFLLVHIAPTFVLVGGLWGQFTGVKALVELKVGQGSYIFQRIQDPQPGTSYVLPGFQVKLERSEFPQCSSEIRLVASVPVGGAAAAPLPAPCGAKSPSLVEGQRGKLSSGLEYEVERVIPDALAFGVETGKLPTPTTLSSDPDVLMVMLGVGRAEPLLGLLHAFGDEAFRKDEPQGRFAVLFRERLDSKLLMTLRPHPPRTEKLAVILAGQTLEIPAKVGECLVVAGSTFKVITVYPDFQVRKDAAGNPVMSSRSAEPREPWLEVELARPGSAPRRVLLSAQQPDYTDQLNAPNLPEGMRLRYLREGGDSQRRYVVFSQLEHKVALVDSGTVLREDTWVLNHPFIVEPGLSVTPMGLYDGFLPMPAGHSAKPGRAAVRVKVIDPLTTASERGWLRADGHPQSFHGGRVSLTCMQAPPDPRGVRSTLLVMDPQGRELARKVISVNDPLIYDGLAFLQSPHSPRDLEASPILVVDQPGAWVAWLGYGMLLMGIAWMFYLKPWLKRREAEGGA